MSSIRTCAATVALAGSLDVLALGAETAQSLGLRVRPVRLVFLALAAALVGAAVSVCGLVGFVGLLVPHIVRRLVGGESRPLVLCSALGGAALMTLCALLAGYHHRTVLRGIDLAFHPGEVLVLIGPNGSGKSTLLRTVLGLVPCTAGEVLLDGVPLRRLSPRQVAQQVSFLSQSRPVPNITARRMVLHGRFPHLAYPRHYRAEDRRIVDEALAAADAANLADRPLPELSGGQRQKVYLAMAIAQQTPTVLMDEPTTFLDEATSSVDTRTEQRIQTAMDNLMRGRTSFVIAHRLSTIRDVDMILVMRDGDIVEQGRHDELLARGGFYAELYNSQFEDVTA